MLLRVLRQPPNICSCIITPKKPETSIVWRAYKLCKIKRESSESETDTDQVTRKHIQEYLELHKCKSGVPDYISYTYRTFTQKLIIPHQNFENTLS